jgi:Ca2+-binding RTX toxin-like protein
VTNTNGVVIADNSNDPATPEEADGGAVVRIDDPADFAPGATLENGGAAFSNIEFQARFGAGFDGITLQTGAQDDTINVGTDPETDTDRINWDPSAADPAPDAELTHSGVDLLQFLVEGGDDLVTAEGGNGTGDSFAGLAPLVMVGVGGVDTFTGGLGEDVLVGGRGDDILLGGLGEDRLDGGEGDDTIAGGDGAHDVASFGGANRPVSVDLNLTGSQDTGAGNDVLTGVEDVRGSLNPDTLIGDAGANFLSGEDGDDMLDGGLGDDMLIGASGVDTVTYAHAGTGVAANLASGAFGGGGNDTLGGVENLVGSPFADDLTGGDGPNSITGLGGVDRISALGGPDIVNARDGGLDTVSCGNDADSVLGDPRSVDASIDGDCETVDFLPEPPIADPPPGVPPGGVPPGGAASPDTTISAVLRGARSQRVLKQNGVIVKVGCPLEDCTARASGGSSKLRLKPLTRTIRSGATGTVKLRLAKRQRRALKSAFAAGRRPKLRVTARMTDAAGNAATRSLSVKAKP